MTLPETETLTLAEIGALARSVLLAAGASPAQAAPLAEAIAKAEADAIPSHGLMYLPVYAEHLGCGKVDGRAVPVLDRPRPGTVRVDAATGFAHAAIAAGLPLLLHAARQNGIACLAVRNSYNCGVLGHHAEAVAAAGLAALCFTNAPASIAPAGGTRPVVGTNPVAFALTGGPGRARIVIDQSASVVAKSELVKRAKAGRPIPEGWALDAAGNPTTDPSEGLKGTMVPAGGAKGVGLGLIVEGFAALLAGASLGLEAAPFSGTQGGPPRTGQFLIAVDPGATAGAGFGPALERLAAAVEGQAGARLPGARRASARARAEAAGVAVDAALLARIRALPGGTAPRGAP